MQRKPWVGVDLDGTMTMGAVDPADWNFYKIGAPIDAMIRKVKALLATGTKVKIFTARVAGLYSDNINEQIQAKQVRAIIVDWSEDIFGAPLEVTAHKDFDMIEYWDDRARGVVFNKGVFVV